MRFPVPRHAAAHAKRLGGFGLLKLYTTWRFTPDWPLLLGLDNAADKRSWFAALRYGVR